LARVTWPRSVTSGQEIAVAVADKAGDAIAPLVDALVRGGDAAALLRTISTVVKGANRVALDLVDAALLLAPELHACLVTRSLIHVHLGAPQRALADARRLPDGWQEQRQLLLDYTRVLFPTFDFWPARTTVETSFQESPAAPGQPLDAIR